MFEKLRQNMGMKYDQSKEEVENQKNREDREAARVESEKIMVEQKAGAIGSDNANDIVAQAKADHVNRVESSLNNSTASEAIQSGQASITHSSEESDQKVA